MKMFPAFAYARTDGEAHAPNQTPTATPTQAPAADPALDEMRRQMDEMRAQIDRIAGGPQGSAKP